ncbi:MAG: hypothetical protein HZB43_03605 [candidate division Zixibacteria bacterium]|nr:hypothetical protein [candidate division Zixibacteria bacterium]
MNKRWRNSICLVAAIVVASSAANAQVGPGRGSSISENLTYLSWKLSGDTTDLTVSQLFVPILLKVRLADGWNLGLWSAASRSAADGGDSPEISGLNDSKFQLTHTMADGQFVLSAGASVPTGKTKLNATERALIPWLAADFLNFPVKIPGEGLEVFGEAGVALPTSEWVLGFAGAAHYFTKYTPYDDDREYQPGMRIIGTAGIGRDWENHGHLGFDLLAIYSTDDKVDGNAVFGDGMQLEARVVARTGSARGGIDAMARFIQRGKDRILLPSSPDPITEPSNTNGNDFRFHLAAHHLLAGKLSGWVSFDTKMLMANGYAADNPRFQDAARILGFGGGFDIGLGERSSFGVGGRYWTGSSDGAFAREKLDMAGFEIIQRLSISL